MVVNIEKKTFRERAYNALKESILKNELLPDQEVSITSLATNLGISETPVREALAVLKAEGLIEYESHKRPRVATITEEDVRQVYEIRKLLEPYAATLLIPSIGKCPDLRARLERLREKTDSASVASDEMGQDLTAVDFELNEIFLEAAGKSLFQEIFSFVSARSIRIRTLVEARSKARSMDVIHKITQEHKEIIEAVLTQDSDRTQRNVLQHLLKGESRTLKEIEKFRRER
jgi:DNA-binding GntR family transcriptional regulator